MQSKTNIIIYNINIYIFANSPLGDLQAIVTFLPAYYF